MQLTACLDSKECLSAKYCARAEVLAKKDERDKQHYWPQKNFKCAAFYDTVLGFYD